MIAGMCAKCANIFTYFLIGPLHLIVKSPRTGCTMNAIVFLKVGRNWTYTLGASGLLGLNVVSCVVSLLFIGLYCSHLFQCLFETDSTTDKTASGQAT